MTSTPLRDLLSTGVSHGVWSNYADPRIAGTLSGAGFGWFCVDEQHGFAPADLAGVIGAAHAGGLPGVVRVAWNRPELIGRALDCGAAGVIVPMVQNAAEAADAAAASRYAPHGRRSFGPARGPFGIVASYADVAAASVVCLVMVETAEALDNVDEIAATAGVDGIFVGPFDLSLALGLNVDEMLADRAPESPLARIVAACQAHGIVAAAYGGVPARSRLLAEQGFTMIASATDDGLLVAGAAAVLAEL
jgi:4-hydroxy-2-oxoheptanedioate aldolase